MTIFTADVDTPVGVVRVGVRDDRVVAACFTDHWDRVSATVQRRFDDRWQPSGSEPSRALVRYVAGDVHALVDVDVDVAGSGFQQRVWSTLRTIPAGRTWSYAQLAAAVGSPRAVRAVGTANGANPAWLVVPCHRVVRSDGALGGYGGGVDRKAWLLDHEGAR